MKSINFILNTLLAIVVVGVVTFLLASRFGILNPLEIKIVRSGSMEPAIHTGSIVLIKPATTYNVGDVITFGKDTRTSVPTTHRIVSTRTENGTAYFNTKGDANEDVDGAETPLNKVIGQVIFTVPYVGYILAFAKTSFGFALLIGIPATLIICYEIISIVGEIKVIFGRKRKKEEVKIVEVPKQILRLSRQDRARRVMKVFSVPQFDIGVPAKLV